MLIEFKTSGRTLKSKDDSEDGQKMVRSSLSGRGFQAVYIHSFMALKF